MVNKSLIYLPLDSRFRGNDELLGAAFACLPLDFRFREMTEILPVGAGNTPSCNH